MILTGDCRKVMATLDADSIDAIVTDPPYYAAEIEQAIAMVTPPDPPLPKETK